MLLVGLAVLAAVLCLKFTHTRTMAIFTTSSRSVPMANNGTVSDIPTHLLELLTPKCKACIERLRTCRIDRPDLYVNSHNPRKVPPDNHAIPRSSRQPTSKLAAVLVLLYEQAGELRVLLTTRSKSLRAHPGQTALPGGKADDGDESLVWTAVSSLCFIYYVSLAAHSYCPSCAHCILTPDSSFCAPTPFSSVKQMKKSVSLFRPHHPTYTS